MGLPPPEPTYHPWGLKNSASIIQKILKYQIPTDSERDLDFLLGKKEPVNNGKGQENDQIDPDIGSRVQLKHAPVLTIKSTPEGRTVYWTYPREDRNLESTLLPYQEGLPLPSPCLESNNKDPSREVLMVRLMEIDNDDDSMERINLEDYNSDEFNEYLSDDDLPPTTEEVPANLDPEPYRPLQVSRSP